MKKNNVVIVGAGPSGLAAATESLKNTNNIKIFEKTNNVGGLARSEKFRDCIFDVGPHRFYTLNKEINEFFKNNIENESIKVKRLTRILYKKKLFLYPLSPFNTLLRLGFIEAIEMLISYSSIRIKSIFKKKTIKNFEDWVIFNFGNKLYSTFFKSYTEKVWGIDCKTISSDWASQRIKNLSFISVLLNPLRKILSKRKIKSLVDSFLYPKFGAGYFYQILVDNLKKKNVNINFNSEIKSINIKDNIVSSIEVLHGNKVEIHYGDYFLLSNPFTDIFKLLNPKPPQEIINISNKLRYRNHISVQLIIEGKIFDDNWIYVHDQNLKMARVSNYRNFSPHMSPNKNINPVTIEYFCFENDNIWKQNDEYLKELATKELLESGLISKKDKIVDGYIIRSPKAYPVIEKGYDEKVELLKNYINSFKNLIPIGRSGMFKYNNQDHAMATGLYAARNLFTENIIDIWKINSEGVYVESDIEINK